MDSPNSSISYSQEETTSQFCTPRPATNQDGLSGVSQVDDVLHLTDLNLDTFLRNLQIRFLQGLYYTYIGDVCVSVNPNRTDLSIYGRDFIRLYYEAKQVHKLPPHIFAIAASAYRQTFETNHDSVVIITGESGSGKTEASKLLLLFITHVVKMTQQLCPSAGEGMVKQIAHTESLLLKSNCILEAFGCAQTLRNVNSSRFAKYIEIYLKHSGKLASNFSRYENPGEPNFFALIHSYMLEKSRIITRQKGERNFHIFYQLLASLDDTSKCQLGLTDDAAEYRYLGDSILTNHDGEIFKKVLEAMDMVGFTCHEKQTIFQMLAAILHLGNLQMESAQGSRRQDGLHGMVSVRVKATSDLSLEHFCRLLSIDIEVLVATLCSRQIWVRGERLLKPYSLVESLNGRNALAKALYERTFNFIVSLINRSLLVNKSPLSDKLKVNTIGLLDIYGFEVSSNQANLFEQFLVNYCNEKLHQVFLDVILKKEQKLYHHEDINWQMVEYKDNLPICLLLDEPHRGIFPLIDEACTSGQDNSDELLLEEFNKRFAKSAYFASRSLNPSFRHLRHQKDFLVRHYAGDVIYSIKGFTRKNMDPLHADFKRLMHRSTNALIREMWPDGKSNDALPNRPPISTAMEYRKSMNQLISCLTKKRQFFICCIKPNEEPNEESVDKFHDDKVRHQIQYLGLVENARVRKAGFFHRYFYQGFLQRYRMLYRGHLSQEATQLGQTQPDNQTDRRPIFRPACEQIIADYWTGSVEKRVAFGKSMIFFREMAIIDCLEQKRDQCLERIVFRLQTYSRAFLGKRSFARLKAASLVLKLYTRYMKFKFLGGIIGKLNEYERELRSVCANTPLLEYHQLDLFQWPAMEHCSPGHDQLLASQLSRLGSQLNEWLLILKFPAEYWKDKLIRLEACKIFWQKKTDWGETRRRWLGNYLTSASDCRQHIAFGDFFRKNASTFVEVHFASYLVKTSMHNVEQVCAIVMTSTQLYKVDLDDLSYSLWLPIQDVFSVSVSPDADQLVVLHRKPHTHSSDLFFSFYSCKEGPPLSNHTSQTVAPASSKVGEFVALLSRQYQSITESTLKVNFSSQIHFHLCGLQHTVEVVTRGHASEHLYGHFSARLFRFFTWKRLHRLYLRMTPTALSSTTNSAYELLNKRVDFEMLDKGSFVLIYKK